MDIRKSLCVPQHVLHAVERDHDAVLSAVHSLPQRRSHFARMEQVAHGRNNAELQKPLELKVRPTMQRVAKHEAHLVLGVRTGGREQSDQWWKEAGIEDRLDLRRTARSH